MRFSGILKAIHRRSYGSPYQVERPPPCLNSKPLSTSEVNVALRVFGLAPNSRTISRAGKITLPFHYAEGTFLTYAPGAGMDYLVNDRLTVRVIDFEYQLWPDFSSYGELRPYGVSAGISFRLNPVDHTPKNAGRLRWH